ncbi:hypothetical protein [Rugamonas rubra]|uniref:hypothetical protein n=1 Tax=Rugamonas rubra TaxID=758825 RepID=UPI001581A101|nr:hypothetical protein [Rugamonas rubra]
MDFFVEIADFFHVQAHDVFQVVVFHRFVLSRRRRPKDACTKPGSTAAPARAAEQF